MQGGGFLSLLCSINDKPLEYWSKQRSRTGSIRRVLDEELNENVLEIQDVEDSNCQKTWIMCPPETNQILNVKLPFLVIVLKSTHPQCYFQLQLIDKENVKHLINFSTVEFKRNSAVKTTPNRLRLSLEPGWNRVEIDLVHWSTILDVQFDAVARLKICANCRIRRIYFIDRHYDDNEMALGLYQGFLDLYMLKWGIKAVERASQTKKTTGKISPMKEALRPTNGFHRLFLKNLQAKSDKIVEEFFAKQPVKSVKCYLEFKRRAKIKPYVIPDANKVNNTKNSDTSVLDFKELKKNFMQENFLYKKLSFEDKNGKKNKVQEENPKTDKYELKPFVYKFRKSIYPANEATSGKRKEKGSSNASVGAGKNEKLTKYPNLIKFKPTF